MKRSLFAAFAALTLLVAAPLVAQQEEYVEPQQEENAAPQDESLEPYESRTNPDADSIAGDSGLTITGTVEEWNDEQLALRTTTGIEHIQIVPRTDRPATLEVGENVSVDYTRTSQGVMIATEIRPEGTATGVGVDTTSDLTADTEPMADETVETDLQAEADVDTSLESDFETDVDTDLDTQADLDTDTGFDAEADLDTQADLDDDTMDSTLPATGSELPLLALLGLLSIVAAVGVRSLIR